MITQNKSKDQEAHISLAQSLAQMIKYTKRMKQINHVDFFLNDNIAHESREAGEDFCKDLLSKIEETIEKELLKAKPDCFHSWTSGTLPLPRKEFVWGWPESDAEDSYDEN